MALGSIQPLTERVPGILPGSKGGRCVGLTTLQSTCADCLKSGSLKLLEPSGPVQVCALIALPFRQNILVIYSYTSFTCL